MIDWLNDNSGVVQAAATIVLVLITGAYAWRTHVISKANLRMAQEMQEQRQDDLLPVIDISFNDSLNGELKNAFGYQEGIWPETRHVRLSNLGRGAAFDVEFRIKISEQPIVHRISVVPAGCEAPVTSYGAKGFHIELLENGHRNERRIEILYRDAYGRHIKTERTLRYHSETGHLEVLPLQLEKIGAMRDP